MKMRWLKMVLPVAASVLLMSCAAPQVVPTFTPQNLNPMLQSGDYVQKVDNFVVIVDKSGTMGDSYKGELKLDTAKRLASRMNHTIPDLDLTGALRIFGRTAVFDNELTKLYWGPAPYDTGALDAGLNKIGFSVGDSPLNQALDATVQDFRSAQGDIAVIIFTDADKDVMVYDAVKKSAANLNTQYGNRICIYGVQIGVDPDGKKLLEEVVETGQCGTYVTGDQIASPEGMADFVTRVFLKKAPPKPAPVVEEKVVEEKAPVLLDSDGDGVVDKLDKCPGTPEGAKVDKDGCWVLGDVLFDFDSYTIKPQFYHLLNEVAVVFEKNPDLRVRIEGYTDNVGPAAYNMKLSLKRAKAVMNYLMEKGVAKDRLSAEGYGLTKPRAPNSTEEGRALNRRVELTPIR
ncbi:MAG: OmpA family protein [Deltaproteobacteria bacterium]|nr:OmpA family protein [Deltaproteobacteria bacterium]